ncbi:kinase-like domain-containing protein [Blakeslea trispora]|nr:kinase-like domain-containing protein [Blakeslea trispora]
MATSPSLKICPSQSPTSSPSKLSLLFKKKPKNDPHFVKFQTWSKQHRVLEDQSSEANEQMSWIHFLEEEQADLSLITPPVKTRPRSSTDASLIPDEGLALLDKAGHLLARYKLGNVIGKGHFGTVYRALDLMSGKTVAVKQISLKDARKGDIEDMMQEASLLSSLTHPNIVKYEGFIQTEDHMNIALEFVENGSLLHTLKHFGGALPEHLVAGYCYDILQGLVYLHQQDVVHCDLKAANILTTKTGDVKLSDFGVSLSLKLKDKDDETIVSGTPFWMSPEVIELKGASVQSDIWSLGCTVIELCTGKPPYADLIAMTAMFRIVEDDCPPLPTDISDVSDKIIQEEEMTSNDLKRTSWTFLNSASRKIL